MPEYSINSFSVHSDLPLPCAPGPAPGEERPGHCQPGQLRVRCVTRLGDFPDMAPLSAAGARTRGVSCFRAGGGILLDCPSPAGLRLHIDSTGSTITVECSPDSDDNFIASAGAYVVGPALALCALFAGQVPLHAAGAEFAGRRFGLLGPPGTGKSTTLWALLRDGALFANDDTIPVRLDGQDGRVLAVASGSLYPKTDAALLAWADLDSGGGCYPEVLPGNGKFWYPLLAGRRAVGTRLLSALFVLAPGTDGQQGISVRLVGGGARLTLLMKNLMAPLTTAGLLGAGHLMDNAAAVANSVPMFVVHYPRRFDALPSLAKAIFHTLETLP